MEKLTQSKLNEIENEIQSLKIMIRISTLKPQFVRAAGGWADLDTETLKRKIYESRYGKN